jgi:hypothetical protein
MLNGVRVPQWLAETRDTDINPQRISEITNAEVRREFVRKVGAERLCYALNAKVLDKSANGMYELLQLDLGGGREWLYLKMLNPSLSTPDTPVWHVEGVANQCQTVHDALLYRINGDGQRRYRWSTDGRGADWWIHGDVIVIQSGKKVLKRKPRSVA